MTTLLSVNNYFYRYGGAEAVFFEHNRLFEMKGWNVVPFAMQHPRNADTTWSEYFVERIEYGEPYSLAEAAVRATRVIYSVHSRKKLAQLLARVKPDLCHAHNIYHHISPSILGLLSRRGIPVVLTLHDLKIACPAYLMLAQDGVCERCRGGRLHNVVLQRCIKNSVMLSSIVMLEAVVHTLLRSYSRFVDRFVAPSQFHATKIAEWGVPASAIRYVPNFVNASEFEPAYLPGGAVLYFGRLVRQKGLYTLIRAAAAARCKLNIVGTGPELNSLERHAAVEGAAVRFFGHLQGRDLHDVVRSARAVVVPSESYENAPMTILEAYALGKPVVGARIGGIPELIRQNETGLLFDYGDVAALTATLRQVCDASDSVLCDMGRCARRWVEEDFSASNYADRIEGVYGELGVG